MNRIGNIGDMQIQSGPDDARALHALPTSAIPGASDGQAPPGRSTAGPQRPGLWQNLWTTSEVGRVPVRIACEPSRNQNRAESERGAPQSPHDRRRSNHNRERSRRMHNLSPLRTSDDPPAGAPAARQASADTELVITTRDPAPAHSGGDREYPARWGAVRACRHRTARQRSGAANERCRRSR